MDHEKKIMEEMENDTEKHVNKEGNLFAIQKLFGTTNVIRGAAAKELVSTPSERIDF